MCWFSISVVLLTDTVIIHDLYNKMLGLFCKLYVIKIEFLPDVCTNNAIKNPFFSYHMSRILNIHRLVFLLFQAYNCVLKYLRLLLLLQKRKKVLVTVFVLGWSQEKERRREMIKLGSFFTLLAYEIHISNSAKCSNTIELPYNPGQH